VLSRLVDVLVLALLIAWPLAELFVIVKLAEAIGVLLTLVLLIAAWPLGAWIIRLRALVLWRQTLASLAAGRAPAKEALDGLLVLMAGLLFLIPGFITDAVAIIVLLPPTRAAVRAWLRRHNRSRVIQGAARFAGTRNYDVEGSAHDFEPPRLRP